MISELVNDTQTNSDWLAQGQPAQSTPNSTRTAVVTLTCAPSLDRVYLCDSFAIGKVNRPGKAHTYLAGNGVNVAHALTLAGNPVRSVLPVGIPDLAEYRDLFGKDLSSLVLHDGRIRKNTILVDASGETTNINEHPTPLSPDIWHRLKASAFESVVGTRADWLVITGTIPRMQDGSDATEELVQLASHVQDLGVRVCFDVPAPLLNEILARGMRPDLVKPNIDELAEAVGHPIHTLDDVTRAASELTSCGVGAVLASLGSDGLQYVDNRRHIHQPARHAVVKNTTGAGDATLAGFLGTLPSDMPRGTSYDDHALVTALAAATAWGAAAVEQVSPHLSAIPPVG